MMRLKSEKTITPDDEKKIARMATIQNVVLFGAICGLIRAGENILHFQEGRLGHLGNEIFRNLRTTFNTVYFITIRIGDCILQGLVIDS